MKWYKFDVDYFLDAFQGLSNDQELAYRRLIDAYYVTEQPLPNDKRELASLTGVSEHDTLYVLKKFFKPSKDGWRDESIDYAIGKHQQQVRINREIGKRGGRPKRST